MLRALVSNKKIVFQFLLFIFAFLVFQNNAFNTVDRVFFDTFQKDSEALVVGSIVADDLQIDKEKWNLGFIAKNYPFDYPKDIMDSYEIFSSKKDSENAVFWPYRSQVGAQGIFYSVIEQWFSLDSLAIIQSIPSAILALLIVAFYPVNSKIYGTKYALIFSLSLIFSPWVAAFARNLYWSEFLWLLPCFFSSIAYLSKSIRYRNLLYFFIYLTFLAKSLCGYEYITSITLLACSPFILGPFFSGFYRPRWKSAFVVFALCVAGFFSAFIVHANMRGDSLVAGTVAIYQEDVKRRTYSDPSNFDSSLKDSLNANPIVVVGRYVVKWSTPLFPGVPGFAFMALIVLVVTGLFILKKINHKYFVRDFVLISYMSLIPLSWFILAKGHSYIHVHMNFVLWYLGFIPALIFCFVSSVNIMVGTLLRADKIDSSGFNL